MQQLAKLNITLGQLLQSLVYAGAFVGFLINNQVNMGRIEEKIDSFNQRLVKIESKIEKHTERIDQLEIYSAVHEANEQTLSFLRKNPKLLK